MRALLLLTVTIAAPVLAKRDPEFGSTVLIDERMQIVDLHPHHAGRIMEGASGHRSSEAILRYEEGRLKPLLKTNGQTDVGGQGGAGDVPAASVPIINSGSPN